MTNIIKDNNTNNNKENYVCIKCGKVFKEPQIFCNNCGYKMDKSNQNKNPKIFKKIQPQKTFYCTNCGEKNVKKICHSCGLKNKKTHKFCYWCGHKLNEYASICTNCNEKVKNEFFNYVIDIVSLLWFIICIDYLFNEGIYDFQITAKIAIFFSAILAIPTFNNLIKIYSHKNRALRPILHCIRFFLIIGLVSFAIDHSYYTLDNSQAIIASEKVLKQENKIDNNSYILNDAMVLQDEKPYKGDEELMLVTVKLNYSTKEKAKNKKSIKIIFNKTEGWYYNLDGKVLIKKGVI